MPMNTEVYHKSLEVVKKVQEEVAIIRWTIDNFTETYESARGDDLNSEGFYIENNVFALVLTCPESDDDGNFVFQVFQHPDEENLIDIKCNGWLEDIDGNKYCESEVQESEKRGNAGAMHFFSKAFQKQDLGTAIRLRDDTAIFCAEVKKHVPGELFVPPKLDLELRQKLWNSYQHGLIDSITIQVEGKELKVSKNILAANSDVFQQMLLTANCKEVQTGVIEIKEASYEVMKAFIEYMHRGEVNNLPDICDDLFILAHKYLVVSLQEDCAKEMAKSLNEENIFDRLKIAFLYGQEELKEATLEYVTKQESDLNFHQILMSAQWISFSFENMSLAQEIMNAAFEKMQFFSEQDDDQTSTESWTDSD